jgi:L-histidine Nalpha-methyltransferase
VFEEAGLKEGRLEFLAPPSEESGASFASAVRSGLSGSDKKLEPRFFYDAEGSRLFELITRLPEYYLTEREQSILSEHSGVIAEAFGSPMEIVEFGSGNSCKTRMMIEAALRRQPDLRYIPIDISGHYLRSASLQLLEEYPRLRVAAVAAEYYTALRHLPARQNRRLFLFLGSNIGNFEPDEASRFLQAVAAAMGPDDSLLLGADLVKEVSVIEAAYNDVQGITAQFNLNVLVRINRELGGNFDLSAFRHEARWDPDAQRIEMRLVSEADQEVEIPRLDLTVRFRKGEPVVTEYSHKYTLESLRRLAASGGFQPEQHWLDDKQWFGLFLMKKM